MFFPRAGIEQINHAIAQMDQVTQQNASLVEEAAAASESMQNEAQKLAETVSVFKVPGAHQIDATPVVGPKRSAASRVAAPAVKAPVQLRPAPSTNRGAAPRLTQSAGDD